MRKFRVSVDIDTWDFRLPNKATRKEIDAAARRAIALGADIEVRELFTDRTSERVIEFGENGNG